MSRPTALQVDNCLSHAEGDSGDLVHLTLAAEVRALRNELEYERQLRTRLESELRELSARMLSNAEVLP